MLKPLLDRVLLKKIEEENVTASGLVVSKENKELPNTGLVISVGPGKIDDHGNKIDMVVKEGDIVIFKQYAGTEVEDNQEKYVIVEMKDILAIKEKDVK
ncbi:MAG TPA: co-chaperone GroES [Erysipelothrix sp.]|jgi:chaperonin GroES|nr:co-chaperone GroES [Erysipelothrix sp.]